MGARGITKRVATEELPNGIWTFFFSFIFYFCRGGETILDFLKGENLVVGGGVFSVRQAIKTASFFFFMVFFGFLD